MAYRNFENQPTYAPPEIDILPRSLALLQTAQQQRAAQNQSKRNLAATYKADQLASKFTTDQDDLNHLSKEITQRAMQDIMSTGTISPQTKEMQGRAIGYKNQSDAQWEMFNKGQELIKSKAAQNKYYMPDADQETITKATYGDDNEPVNFNSRGDRLQGALSSIGTDYLKTFNKDLYDSDYVNTLKTQQRESTAKGENGIKNGSKVEAIFLDANGKPVVTDEHAIDYLDSSPDLKRYYDQSLMSDIKKEAKQIKASGAEWTQGKSEDQIATELINNPSKNPINGNSFGARQRDMAKSDLERKQRQNISTSYDASDKPIGSQYGVTAKNVSAAPSYNAGTYSGPGIVYRKDSVTSPQIRIQTRSPKRINADTGQVSGSNEAREMMLNDVIIVPVSVDGTPINVPGNTTEEVIANIKTLPPDKRQQIANFSLAGRGKTINKRQAIDATYSKIQKNEAAIANSTSDTEKANLQKQNDELRKMGETIGVDGEGMNPELMQTMLGADIVQNEIVPFLNTNKDEFNIAQIASSTGSNLGNQNNWTPEMKKYAQAITEVVNENKNAHQNPRAVQKSKAKPTSESKGPVAITSQEAYDKLPSGTTYVDGNGVTRKKK